MRADRREVREAASVRNTWRKAEHAARRPTPWSQPSGCAQSRARWLSSALTIAALYKNRWQVELFFKWIKQHLRIKTFLGTSENAVKTQIWCAVSTYVLIAIVKKELQLDASLYTLLQILSVSLFEKNQLSCALRPDVSTIEASSSANQLILFEF